VLSVVASSLYGRSTVCGSFYRWGHVRPEHRYLRSLSDCYEGNMIKALLRGHGQAPSYFTLGWNQRRQGVAPATMTRNQSQQTQQGTRGTFLQPMASQPSMATQGNHVGTYTGSSQTQDMGVRRLYCCCPWGLLNGDCCNSTTFMSTSNQQGQAGYTSFGSVGVGRGGPSPSYRSGTGSSSRFGAYQNQSMRAAR